MRRLTRGVVAGIVCALVVIVTGIVPAGAHVTINPDKAEQGDFAIVSFSVPNERSDSGTVKLEVKFPEDHPIAFVSVQPKPGWTITVTRRTLDEPIGEHGDEIDEVVDTITWEGGPLNPGEFDLFSISMGPLPTDVKRLEFPAVQTYESGEEVRWIETASGGDEAEFPTPTLKLKAPKKNGHD
ncbi:MAG: YcnI family protein [Actinobacteria bacterium]|nr:YcnI family protein [Actinomycetota bacterium]